MGIALWQKREMEQQELIESIMLRVRDAADASGSYELYMLRFATDIAAFAARQWSAVPLVPADRVGLVAKIHDEQIVPFSRAESERLYLLSQLMKKVHEAVYFILGHAYGGKTALSPNEIFGGDPTDEVDAPAES